MSNSDLSKRAKQGQLARFDNEMLLDSIGVLNDVLDFANIDPAQDEPPNEWVRQLGEKEAWRKFRLARAGWKPARELPSGVKIASTVVIEVMKAKLQPQQDPERRALKKPKISKTEGATDIDKFGELSVDE